MIRILAAADLHLGRRPAPLHASATPALFTPKAAFEGLINVAISQKVDILCFAGDLVDQDNDFFESLVPFQKGLERLAAASIPFVVVAGNHDAKILPKLVRAVPGEYLHFLGAGGSWERLELTVRGKKLAIDGWSFPDSSYEDNPFDSYDLPEPEGLAIGLLHGECPGGRLSRYAPTQLSSYEGKAHLTWILGHHHTSSKLTQRVFYCGSLLALDKSERGVHGAHLLTLEDGKVESQLVPLSPLRFEEMVLKADGITVDGFENALTDSFRIFDETLSEDCAEICGCHLRITGVTPYFTQFYEKFLGFENEICFSGKRRYYIYRMSDESEVDLDLHELKTGPMGALAQNQLALLEQDSLRKASLIAEAMEQVKQNLSSHFFTTFSEEISDELLCSALLESGSAILKGLARQKEDSHEA